MAGPPVGAGSVAAKLRERKRTMTGGFNPDAKLDPSQVTDLRYSPMKGFDRHVGFYDMLAGYQLRAPRKTHGTQVT